MLMSGADPECDTPVMVKLVVDAEVRVVLFYRSGAMHLGLHLIVSIRRHTIGGKVPTYKLQIRHGDTTPEAVSRPGGVT